jgi:Fic family protein
MVSETELDFLRESNAIEGVWDDQSLESAVAAWELLKDQETLTIAAVKAVHTILMREHLRNDVKNLGTWRQQPVWIGRGQGMPWFAIPELMENWANLANEEMCEEEIERHHIQYEAIHPFIDGNGRTGRMFMNWQRLKNDLPILTIWENNKNEYYKWFQKEDERRAKYKTGNN